LPVKTVVDLPMIPPMGKHAIPVVSALIGCWLIKNKKIPYIKGLGKSKFLVILFVITPFVTAWLNKDVLNFGGEILPSLTYYDGLSDTVNQLLIITPFFIGRQFFRTYEHQLLMFKILVMAGLFYSIPMLFEVRMSPQLHTWLYDYFPHSFGQQKRFGGFRPVVFMGHGLLVAFFVALVLLSSVAIWKAQEKIRNFSPKVVSYYLLIVLVLCKSIAPLLYGVFAFFTLKNISSKVQHKIAVSLVCLAILYPLLSISNIFPHQKLVDIAALISPERAQSLEFRFDNENILLDHAKERFFFGWGGWGRNRVYDDVTGKDLSVTDGGWIITLGKFGFFGFIAVFGLLGQAVFKSIKASHLLTNKREKTILSAHALLVGIIMINQLPNNSLAPWLWLIAGILFGRSESILNSKPEKYI